MNSTCFFIGHRDTPEYISALLTIEVERHIVEYGVTDFLVGGYGRFDRMAVHAVREAKSAHPNVTLSLVLAYLPEPGSGPDNTSYDGILYPEGLETVPKRLAILRRNEWLARECGYLIAYVAHGWGGAARTLEYAHAKQKRSAMVITNLFAQSN